MLEKFKYNKIMSTLTSLSVFFPAYNEENNISDTVDKALKVLPQIAKKYEIIIVNDGSKDKTGEIADKLSRQHKEVRVIHHEKNRGYGGALKTGMYGASYEVIAFTDSDGQFDFSQIKKFIPYLKDFDMVIGYRKKRAEGLRRDINAKAWGILMKIVFGIKARDIDCAFKVFYRSVLDKIPRLESNGALISAELLMKAHVNHIKIKEIPVDHFPRKAGSPTGANLNVIIKAFKELLQMRQKINSKGKFL